jgi:hypothetical protein
MGDTFEFREDFKRAEASSGCPVQLCPVKWQTEKHMNNYVRKMALSGDGEARRLGDLLDQVGITPDFEPSPVHVEPDTTARKTITAIVK